METLTDQLPEDMTQSSNIGDQKIPKAASMATIQDVSGDISYEEMATDKPTMATAATHTTSIEQPSSGIPLAATIDSSDPLFEPTDLQTMDTMDAMVIDGGQEPGGEDRMEMDAPTDNLVQQKQIIGVETPAEPEKIDIEIIGTAELMGINARADSPVEQKETIDLNDTTVKTQKTNTEAPGAKELGDINPMESVANKSEIVENDEMDVNAPETDQQKAEDDGVQDVEDTISTAWTLPSIIDDGAEPMLSLKQLIIMALVTSPTRSMSVEEICQWINGGFSYYKDQTFQHTLNPSSRNWMEELSDILHRYDFPTEPIENTNAENKNVLLHLPPGREWHILPKPDKMKAKPFRLMELPFDIRLMILELVLHRPLPKKHGWIIDPVYTAKRKEIYRKASHTPQHLKAIGPHDWELRTDRLDKVLALLSVNKQLYAEAAPVFYRTNFFEFDSTVTLSRFFDGIPFRRKWIRNLILHYDPPIHGHNATRAFNHLKEAKLRNLHIFLKEDKLIKRHDLTRFSDPIARLPGMKALGEVRGLSRVAMHGPCTKTTKFLSKITEWKKNDSKDDDELIEMRRQKEKDKYAAAIKRLWKDTKARHDKEAAEALKKKHAQEREALKLQREGERKAKAEERAAEVKARNEARKKKSAESAINKKATLSAARKRNQKDKATIKNIKGEMSGMSKSTAADEDTSSDDDGSSEEPSEELESESEDSSSEESEEEPLPPPKRKKLAATSAIAAAKASAAQRNNTKIPIKPAPAPAPKPIMTKSATGVRSVTTKSGITARGSSAPKKVATATVKIKGTRSVVYSEPARPKKMATGSVVKKPATPKGVKRKSDMASVFEVEELVVIESDGEDEDSD